MSKRVTLYIPDMYYEKLVYLEKNGYGKKSDIVKSSGILNTISDIYSDARSEEMRRCLVDKDSE